MAILWINLIVVYISSFVSRYLSTPSSAKSSFVTPNKFFVFVSMLSFVLVSGLRNTIGDTYNYILSYINGDLSLRNFNFKGDFGFNIFQTLLHQVTQDPQYLIFTTALITNVIIVIVFYKYSRMIEISLYVYITSDLFIVSMNGLRQFLAAAIIFAATKYLINGNWKIFVLIVLLASTFHQSSLVMIPIYFLVRRPAWTKATFILLGLAVFVTMGFNQFSQVLFTVIDDSHYSAYKDVTHGANMLRAVVAGVPLVFAYLGRKKLKELWPESDYIVNLSLLGFVFMVIATQNWIFARFNVYFGLYSTILISWIVQLFVTQERKIIYFGLLICYFIYFYYEQVISLGLQYRSAFLTW